MFQLSACYNVSILKVSLRLNTFFSILAHTFLHILSFFALDSIVHFLLVAVSFSAATAAAAVVVVVAAILFNSCLMATVAFDSHHVLERERSLINSVSTE